MKDNDKNYDFNFGLTIPINRPTQRDIDNLKDEQMEEYIKHFISTGYMTKEEAVAYITLTTYISSYIPFMLDSFLTSYRESVARLENVG
jgi:hypothetical protein